MPTIYENMQRWFDIQLYGSSKKYYRPHNSNVWGDEHALYSFGQHFHLVEIIRDGRGRPLLILMNGNMYSPTTSSHQRSVRSYIEGQLATGKLYVPHVIIPFDALSSAGVMRSSIRLIHRTDDTWEEKTHHSFTKPEGLRESKMVLRGKWEWDIAQNRHVYKEYDAPKVVVRYSVHSWPCEFSDDVESPTGVMWTWTTRRHWLGESLIRATYTYRYVPSHTRGKGLVATHWAERRAYFLSGFDHNETRPSYFFAQLPSKAKPTTLAEAYECLKPESVKAAEMLGISVKRQGDIFAIELSSITKRDLTKQGATYDRMGSLLDTNHIATDVARLPDGTLLARGNLYHQPRFRRPDHRRVNLGKQWHVIVKNTVPIVGGR